MTKKRIVFKKGHYVSTRKGSYVIKLSEKIVGELKNYSRRIAVVGSIRRGEKNPVDIDIVLIPKSKKKIVEFMSGKGKFLLGGNKKSAFKINGVKVELNYAGKENWGAMLLTYTGPWEYSVGLRMLAKRKDFLLNQYGLYIRGGRKLAGRNEKDIYRLLGKNWKSPEKRGK